MEPNQERFEQELIDKYFDRNLTPVEEQEFHSSLARNEPLRGLFRSEILLLQAMSETKSGLTIPDDYSADLIPQFGFSVKPAMSRFFGWKRLTSAALLIAGSFGVGYVIRGEHQAASIAGEQQPASSLHAGQTENITPVITEHPMKKNIVTKKKKYVKESLVPATHTVQEATIGEKETHREAEKSIEVRLQPWQKKDSTTHLPK